MTSRLVFRTLIAGALIAISWIPGISLASGGGTSAFVIQSVVLNSGPGANYPDTMINVTQGQVVTISRCSLRWCRLANSNGWLSIDNLSFGQTATGPFSGPKFNGGSGGDGEVCFYSGENFTGNELCLPSGSVARDLSLFGIDNSIASVSIEGEMSVNLCRDRNFSSYCERYDQSAARLNRLLTHAVSSYQVY